MKEKKFPLYLKTVIVFITVIFVCHLSMDAAAEASAPTEEQQSAWFAKVGKNSRAYGTKHFTAILFDQNLEPIKANRYRGAVGDLIYVGILNDKQETGYYYTIQFKPCSLEPAAPSLFSQDSSSLYTDTQQQVIEEVVKEQEGVTILEFPPRDCFNTQVIVEVNKLAVGNDKPVATGSFVLQQYPRYRATFQLGILFSKLNKADYGLMDDGTGQQIIYNKLYADTDPHYSFSVIIYSFPRYIQGLFSSKYHFEGRDIVNERGFIDRIGLVIGASTTAPLDRFYLGLSFELFYGINVIGAYEFAKLDELAGLKEGDIFSGEASAIPTSSTWKSKFVFGFSFDLRYVTGIFKVGSTF